MGQVIDSILDRAIGEIIDDLRMVDGIKSAPQVATDSALLFPFLVVFPGRGRLAQSPAEIYTGVHTIIVEVHVARVDLARAIKAVVPYGDTVPVEIFRGLNADHFNSTVSTIQEIRYNFGPLDWGGTKTIGYQFEVDAKLQAAVGE